MRQFHARNLLYLLLFVGASSLALLLSSLVLPKGFNNSSPSPWPWTTSSSSSSSSFSSPLFLNHTDATRQEREIMDPENVSIKKKKSSVRERPRDAELERVEAGLARARALIISSGTINRSSFSPPPAGEDYVPQGHIYRNPIAFYRSYLVMEKLFKIFIYKEGEAPLFHNGPCKSIYSIEGVFFSLMERDTHFRTHDPHQAHVYFLPFSVVMIIHHLFDPIVRDKYVLKHVVADYVKVISQKYPYWNRSLGADHFMLSCHDWGPRATKYVPELYYNSIRALCNANTSENFNPRKDASIPEINLITGEILGLTGGLPPSQRTVLAFFAGRLHGHIRPTLLHHWMEKDDHVRVYETLPEGLSYHDLMKRSKYCICPSGHEVASPRAVEAIYAECVPVLISQNYVPPFSDVLDWGSFSVQVSVDEIPNLKKILLGIPEDRYLRMQERVKKVQRHFVVNNPPKRFDVFHMIIHSIWLRRLNVAVFN